MLRASEQAERTDTGRQRLANEDSYFARAPVFAVADGMGGARAGEVASGIAAEAFESGARTGEPPEAYLRRVAREANRRIHDLAQEDASRSGMGTTLTAAMVHGDEISVVHVGDSRAYLFRDGKLRRLTSDHSLVEELRRQGRLTEEEAEEHPQRAIITRALGPEPEVEVDTMSYPARGGDVVLLCSDGLTTMVPEDAIAQIARGQRDLDALVGCLVREANEQGGRDNVTVIAVRLEEIGAPAAEEGATLIGPTAKAAGLGTGADPPKATPRPPTETPARARTPGVRVPRAAKLAVGLILLAAIAVGAVLATRQVYFLGTDEGGRIALFRGLPYELPLGIELFDERYSSPLQVDSLPADRAHSVRDHELRSRADAVSLIEDLEIAAEEASTLQDQGDHRASDGSQSSSGAASTNRPERERR
jgi:protein phosphatase